MRSTLLLSLLLSLSLLGAGCVSQPKTADVDDVAYDESSTSDSRDSLESFNRAIFAFNLKLDRWFLKPVAKGYDWVMPNFAERGVRNFFSNLGEVNNVINDVLQWKWKQAGNDTGRFITNTTLGIGGLFDVAEKIGLPESEGEDFGQTFAKWGVGSGPYLMLPFLGPSNFRDGFAIPFDAYMDPVNHINDNGWRIGLSVLELVDRRAQLLETEDLASGDLYLFVRDIYFQRRDYLINDGAVEEDTFGEEDF